MKKILGFIFNPIKHFGQWSFADKIAGFFEKKSYMVYIIAALITIGYVFFKYIFPTLN